jgi:two-component system, OmpR family, phosphate regulon sensor histidine kinase PhoR
MIFLSFLFLLLAVGAAAGWTLSRMRLNRLKIKHRTELEDLRVAHEGALRDHAQRLQALLDSMVEGILVLDEHQGVVLTNRAAAKMFESSYPATGRALLETVRHHEIATLAGRLARETSVLGYELRIEGAPTRFLQVNAVSLHDSGGATNGAVLVFHDFTRIRELEGVRQEFVANVSHELRTPLSLIKGAAETLLDGVKTDPVALDRLLTIIDRHADRLTLLIDDLLLLSKLDSGRVKLNIQPTPLRSSVQEVVDDLTAHARAKGTTIENKVPVDIVAQIDPDRFRQVLFNLIDNAVKYGRPSGNVKISGRVISDRSLELCVADDGPGIPSNARARVFERFFRVDKARSREQGGTGLGLAIVKHVVQAHGGEVRVESELGQGTTFHITIFHITIPR